MATRTGSVNFETPPAPGTTNRVVTVIVTAAPVPPATAGVTLPPIIFDLVVTPGATFTFQDGSVLSATATDTNTDGTSAISDEITDAPPPVAPQPPPAPVLTGFTIV